MENEGRKKWRLLWGTFMVVFYLCMGVLLIFSNLFDIKKEYMIVIGTLFVFYGIFRGYRVWKHGI